MMTTSAKTSTSRNALGSPARTLRSRPCFKVSIRLPASRATRRWYPNGEIEGFVGGHCVGRPSNARRSPFSKAANPELIRVQAKDEVTGEYDLDGVKSLPRCV